MLTQIIITSMTAVFSLPQLPYETNALEPVISKETIDYHYGKHLQAYVNTLNTLVKDTEYEKMNLEEIVRHAPAGPLFNNAGQVLNHTLYFEQFRPVGAGGPAVPEGKLDKAIRTAFGSFDEGLCALVGIRCLGACLLRRLSQSACRPYRSFVADH